MFQVFHQEASVSFVIEAKRNEIVPLDSSASTIIVTQGAFDLIDPEERKFKPLVTQANTPVAIVGNKAVNRAVVFVCEGEPVKRLRPEPVNDDLDDMPPDKSVVNRQALIDNFGYSVVKMCEKLLLYKFVVIQYQKTSLGGKIVKVKLNPVWEIGQDKSFIDLSIEFKVDDVAFVESHTVFAGKFRDLVKRHYLTANISFWQHTYMLTSTDPRRVYMDSVVPRRVRRFSSQTAIQSFLSLS